jgi:hypothetical protein
MADWPDTAELAQVLNVDNVGDWQTTLDRVLAAAIAKVKSDVGSWDEEVDEPTEGMAQAALRMAELISTRPESVSGRSTDATYLRLLTGQRRRFGLA